MTENENKIVELHKHIIAAKNLILEISTFSDIKNVRDCEYLIESLLPLLQNSTEEILEANDLYCINAINADGNLVSDYFEKAEFDPNTKKEDNKTKE